MPVDRHPVYGAAPRRGALAGRARVVPYGGCPTVDDDRFDASIDGARALRASYDEVCVSPDAMLVARVLGDALGVERAPWTGDDAEALHTRRVASARATRRFELLPRGCGARVKLGDFPGRVRWLHLDAAVFDRAAAASRARLSADS